VAYRKPSKKPPALEKITEFDLEMALKHPHKEDVFKAKKIIEGKFPSAPPTPTKKSFKRRMSDGALLGVPSRAAVNIYGREDMFFTLAPVVEKDDVFVGFDETHTILPSGYMNQNDSDGSAFSVTYDDIEIAEEARRVSMMTADSKPFML